MALASSRFLILRLFALGALRGGFLRPSSDRRLFYVLDSDRPFFAWYANRPLHPLPFYRALSDGRRKVWELKQRNKESSF
ncbi:hypothetical protein EDB80DRAFT_736742 [Ilyonectria destructans]|nr:hypothetical protein EDB80DRAFT_736742 [Ilyonectria destructans]